MDRRVEILAPAGSWESLEAAVCAGADAVYAGGERFGARAYAPNFGKEELLRAIDYVHLHGRKLYLTVNTLMKDAQIEELYRYLLPLYHQGLDAVIVQDVGALRMIRETFPHLAIHISTQMTVTNALGADFFREQGAQRIVPAREISLEEIWEMKKRTGLEIECFVHGALCYCYSGQCLLSSMIGGRSGNRGQCAQPCRLPYRVDGGKAQDILSLKDLCTIELLPDLIEAGIDSFKIEGRMKQPDYVGTVTEAYRRYADRYLEKGREGFSVAKEDLRRLKDAYTRRGYCDGYYFQSGGKHMISLERPGKPKVADQGDGRNREAGASGLKIQEKINGKLILSAGMRATLELEFGKLRILQEGDEVQRAMSQPLAKERIEKQMRKTGAEEFCFDRLEIQAEDGIFLPMQALNGLRREAIQTLREAALAGFRRAEGMERALRLSQENPFPEQEGEGFLVSVQTRPQLEAVLEEEAVRAVILDGDLFEDGTLFGDGDLPGFLEKNAGGRRVYFAMPYIFRERAIRAFAPIYEQVSGLCQGALIRNWESLRWLKEKGFAGEILSDYNLYVSNRQSRIFLKEAGIAGYTASVELNGRELESLGMEGAALSVYGYQPVMVTANCIQKNTKGCTGKAAVHVLEDRQKKKFTVKNHCKYCYNIMYNCAPTCLIGQAQEIRRIPGLALRLDFTVESGAKTREVLGQYVRAFVEGERVPLPETAYTKGHFKRGVK